MEGFTVEEHILKIGLKGHCVAPHYTYGLTLDYDGLILRDPGYVSHLVTNGEVVICYAIVFKGLGGVALGSINMKRFRKVFEQYL